MPITHKEQKDRWNKEHETPLALKQMDAKKLSSGVKSFLEFLEKQGSNNLIGLEMGCGKGRNVINLAHQEIVKKMYGFDFSEVAIVEVKKRAKEDYVEEKTQFKVMDATEIWEYDDSFFDFGIDCFASTDIDSPEDRQFAITQMYRVLKPGGYFLVYVMSTDDEYHKLMVQESPAEEQYAFYNTTNGKFEKSFSEEELDIMYQKFIPIELKRFEKTTEFFGKSYYCKHHWRIYQK
jgi:ubiquinone/menaquinone biosynthesis C-methylase UbiE